MLQACQQVTFVPKGGNVYLQPVLTAGRRGHSVRIDVAFPITHGTNVEDGALQGYLKTVGVPFVGPDVLASAVGMDKYVMKTMLRDGGFPVLDCVRLIRGETAEDMIRRIEEKMAYPVIVIYLCGCDFGGACHCKPAGNQLFCGRGCLGC